MTSLPLPSLPPSSSRTDLVPVALRASASARIRFPDIRVGVEQLKLKEAQLFRKVMFNSAAFIIGFSIVFITLGAISTEVAKSSYSTNHSWPVSPVGSSFSSVFT